jgi:hypothetical protein
VRIPGFLGHAVRFIGFSAISHFFLTRKANFPIFRAQKASFYHFTLPKRLSQEGTAVHAGAEDGSTLLCPAVVKYTLAVHRFGTLAVIDQKWFEIIS